MKYDVDVVLVDIEGTTTSISFVKDTLFPYAAENAQSFLQEGWGSAEVQAHAQALTKQMEEDSTGAGFPPGPSELAAYVKTLIAHDRKVGPLKALQGAVWAKGYADGAIQGHVYADVPGALGRWAARARVCVYSSGSAAAQRMLFGHTAYGDLNGHFSGNFDLGVGSKREEGSYRTIAGRLGVPPGRMLFLTDIPEEAAAAVGAGCRVALLARPGNAPLTQAQREAYPVYATFDDICLASS